MIKRGQKRLISLLVSLLLVPASLHLSQTAVLAKNSEGTIRENDQQLIIKMG